MNAVGQVLVVDDDPPVREVLSDYFVTRGYTVVTAGNGREALEAFSRERPDIVLLDMRMPGMDGLQVLKRLREADPDVPVVMVTANDDLALAREALAVGAFDYVAKPFDFEHLNQTVVTALFHSVRTPLDDIPAPPVPADVWSRFVTDVFRVVRSMGPEGRASTGTRLEEAALAAARHALGGHVGDVAAHLLEIELLIGVAHELGELPTTGRTVIETALKAARTAFPSR